MALPILWIGRAYDWVGGSSGAATIFGFAARIALFKGRRRLRRKRRFLVCLSARARSPLRCDIRFPFQAAVTTNCNWMPGRVSRASNRTWIDGWTIRSKIAETAFSIRFIRVWWERTQCKLTNVSIGYCRLLYPTGHSRTIRIRWATVSLIHRTGTTRS